MTNGFDTASSKKKTRVNGVNQHGAWRRLCARLDRHIAARSARIKHRASARIARTRKTNSSLSRARDDDQSVAISWSRRIVNNHVMNAISLAKIGRARISNIKKNNNGYPRSYRLARIETACHRENIEIWRHVHGQRMIIWISGDASISEKKNRVGSLIIEKKKMDR